MAGSLESRVNDDREDLTPAVIGGVSRIEEFIKDLLSASRYARGRRRDGREDAGMPAGLSGTVTGVAELTDALQWLHPETPHGA